MNKTVLMTATIASLAVNVFAADNNFIGGTDNTVTNNAKSVGVVGYQNTVGGNNAVAFGENNIANGTNSFAGGNNSKAMGRNSFAYGSHAEALTEYTYAIGSQARTSAYDTVAIGNGAYVSGVSSVAIGRTNNITGENTVVVGANNKDIKGNQSTVIGYNNKMAGDMEQTIIGANSETSGQGAMAIGTHTQATAIDAVAVGNNIIADKQNSVAIGTNSVTDDAVGVDGITINGTRHVFAGEQPASVVSFGARDRAGAGGVKYYNRQLQNVSAGRVEADSLDAINGSQLFAVVSELETTDGKVDAVITRVDRHDQRIDKNVQAIANHEGRIQTLEQDNKDIKSNVANTQNQVNINTKDIADLKGKVGNVAAIKNELNNKVNNLGQRVNKLGASSAALAGLHPLDFNRNDKASYAVSYGHYRNANAVALGAFYRPNERTMIGAGVSLGGETQLTLNVAFKTGKGSDYLAEAKDKDSRISKLEVMVQKLMAEVEQQKAVK
ncbi:MAG: YadA-like family protein [Haemophilus parainfluenzae]|nr:YadA-like family protein [Haemophilus parainfluenzae]